MAGFRNLIVCFVPLLCGAQVAITANLGQTAMSSDANVTCSSGVCSVGKWSLYLSGKTKDECKATCDEGRKMVPEPDGVQEDLYSFRQNGQFHMVAGGKKKPDHNKTVKQINYPSTRNNWEGWTQRDHYYAHWEGKIEIKQAGTYSFFTTSDDGSRMFIEQAPDNWKEVSNNPGWHGMREKGGKIDNMAAGTYSFWAEMFEGGSGAGMQVKYQGADTDNQKVIIPETAFPGGIEETGFYFRQNGRFHDVAKEVKPREPTQSRVVSEINYNSARSWPGIPVRDHYYVRWSGYIGIKAAGKYTFYSRSDDGSRLFIDDKPVVNNPGWHGMREKNGAVENMAAGKHAFSAEMFEGGGGAGMILYYSGPDTGNKKVVIPTAAYSTSLVGSGKMVLNHAWESTGKCAAYSHAGSNCVIYTECDTVSNADDANVCQEKSFDWAGVASDFTTCKYD